MSQAMISIVPSFVPTKSKPHPVPRLTGAALVVLSRVPAMWQQRRARHRLESLDPRMLADIGIGPGQIEHVVRYGRGER